MPPLGLDAFFNWHPFLVSALSLDSVFLRHSFLSAALSPDSSTSSHLIGLIFSWCLFLFTSFLLTALNLDTSLFRFFSCYHFFLTHLYTDVFTHRRFYAEDAFTNKSLHKCLCGKKQFFCFFLHGFFGNPGFEGLFGGYRHELHKHICTTEYPFFHTKKPLHVNSWAQKPLHTENFYTQMPLQTKTFTHTQRLSHTGSFCTQKLSHEKHDTQKSQHTHTDGLHTEYFTRKCFFTHRPLRTNIVRNVCAFGATTPLRSAGHAAAPVRQIWTITTSMCWELGGAVEVANGYHHGYKSR